MELVKVFNFSGKKPGFLEIIEVYLNLGIEFCITWLVLPNYKTLVRKSQFQINHASYIKENNMAASLSISSNAGYIDFNFSVRNYAKDSDNGSKKQRPLG